MDLAEWLRGLGLGQYAPAFAANDIDAVVLRRLTAEDLRELGVASIGHRHRLLDAIAALCAGGEPRAPIPVLAAVGEAERRQLTVLFCDLVGYTALSARLDPEDLHEVISAYNETASEVIRRSGGFVAEYMGDGVLAYFGFPQADENDAERAVHAALELVEGTPKIETRVAVQLQCRVGIATGLVVVDLVGSGEAQKHGALGDTPNLAARLQSLAGPNTVVIGETTHQLVGGLFEYRDRGAVEVKGISVPVRAWQVLRPSVLSRFEALRSEATPLVGRDEELDLLLRRWRQAKTGEGRVALVSGEPGIGKSRLVAELSQRVEGEPHTHLGYFCSPYDQDSALHPFIVQLERAAGFASSDPTDRRLGKLRALLAPGMPGDDEVELLAELMSLPNSAAQLNLSPQRKREKLFDALLRQLQASEPSAPLLMVFEDAHWIDPTSRELLDLTLDRVKRLSALLVVTFRPEFRPAWSGQPHVMTLALNRLGSRDGAALVERLAGNTGLSEDVVEEIVEHADGVPLFVEELTKAVLESGDFDDRVAAVLAVRPSRSLAIPATLHASLIARLDRLGPIAKEVGQIGAVLGREFGYGLIEQVAQRPTAELQSGLDRLAEAGLFYCRGVAPQSSYLFKHALVQEAAYATLLRARRQSLHARVAAVLDKDFADLVERQPELLAHHLTAAGDIERAVDQWLKAGRYAAARLAHFEAIRHFERGLATLSPLPESPDRDGREIELQLARGLSLFTAGGYSSAGAADAYARARKLAERQGDASQLFMALYGLWQANIGSATLVGAHRLSKRLLQLTSSAAEEGLRLQAHHSAWTTCLLAGAPGAAREHCEAGRGLYDPERHHTHRQLYGGHDPGVCARYTGAQAHWVLGYPDKALAICREGLALAEHVGDPLSLEFALVFNAMLHLDRGEPELALQLVESAETLAAEQRLGFLIEPRFVRGAAFSAQGAFDESVACLRDALTGGLGAVTFRPYGFTRLAETLASQGQYGTVTQAVREGMKAQEETGARRWEAELHRLAGIAQIGLNRREEAETALKQALRIARSQQAKSYELRAVTSLAQLWGEQGRRGEARDLLAPVYGWFTEGFDTGDLKDSKALLDWLG